ncbi:MAG: flagellar hook-associated protein FlgK [Bdellovibrionales bacterium]|nr:flagellar hook-associated protein FlgK [Bdellovibrionales bacterium]
MANGISGLLNNSRSSLQAQQSAIRVIGENIANVNTEGYTRRIAGLESIALNSQGGDISFGQGVNIGSISREVDRFLESALGDRLSAFSAAQIRENLLNRAQAPFALDSVSGNVGQKLNDFFSALDDLAVNPADIALRQSVIDQGESLVNAIHVTYDTVASLQQEADGRIGILIQDVNRISGEIADLNLQINASESGDQQNLPLRDKRDALVRDLSELIGVSTLEDSDGNLQVSLANGFALVSGSTSRELEFVTDPTFAPPGGYPTGLNGFGMGHIVFDYDPSGAGSHLGLTNIIAAGGGEIGGLLSFRGVQDAADSTPFDAVGDAVTIASSVEAISRDLLTRFNSRYIGSPNDGDNTIAGFQSSAVDLNGLNPAVFGLFDFVRPDAAALDADGNGLPGPADLNDAVTVGGVVSFASIINFVPDEPQDIAAASDVDPGNGIEFGEGDNSILISILNERKVDRDYGAAFGIPAINDVSTIDELYDSSVTTIGSLTRVAINTRELEGDRVEQLENEKAQKSGVSLDEEFARLINFQRAFQGSARMVGVADDLLAEVIGLLG